jgi:predicted ATPase
MRVAKFKDYWEKVNTRTPVHSAITRIHLENVSYDIANFQVISGQNGSGKSSLLRHLAISTNLCAPILSSVTYDIQNSTISERRKQFQYTSPSWLVEENSRRIVELQSAGQFAEYVEGNEPFEFTNLLLDFVNYILNTCFLAIHVFELDRAQSYSPYEDETHSVDASPDSNSEDEDGINYVDDFLEGKALYIKSSTSSRQPSFVPLSQGEQYIVELIYLLSKKRGQSILVDEPETYLSPLSQYRLADVISYFIVEQKLQFVLATHSICFIEKASISGTLMLDGANRGELHLTSGKRVNSYLRQLGYKVPKENIALFEDTGALRFFANIIRSFDADWLASMELIHLTGESDICAIISRVKAYKILAIFDADQKGKTDPKTYPQHHVTFLPGSLAPEEELINAIRLDPGFFAKRVDISERDLRGYMQMMEGMDHHDYFMKLADILSTEKWKLFDDAFAVWSKQNSTLVDTFLQELLV